MKCPCLYSEAAPICRADMDAMRVPSPGQMSRFCTTDQYRRCDMFRSFLGQLSTKPERWRVSAPVERPEPGGRTAALRRDNSNE